ncbi:hypothetical protein CMV30_09715 [Nibricoccus aquaticus]|uniref:Peptidase S54 rhomboid domain-containing protein n=1 Tax=Nibricoccus aquaticus TaxID=2576891 RepID=A0A290QAI8_9BACT|nr:rhomboid family intramembrane serine protease [Nibricoccus aquaticus]ATC64210.1 hypothetical protein CMV30_09715 [Nibricoccus aquaticus]
MSLLQRLERRLEPFAITNLTLFIVIGQVFVLLTSMMNLIDVNLLTLVPALVQAGEWWRLFTFVFIPPASGYLFIAFALYLLYLYGSALEHFWGPLRYNLFLLTGWALTVGLSFITPYSIATNIFIGGAVFLAFAWVHPNFELLLFFVLPVKIKWLALLAWAGYAFQFFSGGLSAKLAVAAAVGNFLIFFGADLLRALRQQGRRNPAASLRRDDEKASATDARHTCSVCNRTDRTNPELDFRYASDDRCYCTDHLPSRQPTATSDKAAS